MLELTHPLFGVGSGMQLIHSRVVRMGAVMASLVMVILLAVGLITDDSFLLVQAVGPGLAAVFMTTQVVTRRENGTVALWVSAAIVVLSYRFFPNPATLVPAAASLIVIGSLAMILVETAMLPVSVAIGVLMLVAPQFWGLQSSEAWILGVIMTLAFAMTTVILLNVRSVMSQLNARLQMLFERSPTAVMEEDWSEAVAYVRYEYTGRPDRLRAFLLAYPAVVRRAVSKARILKVNRAAVELFEADDAEDLLGPRFPEKVTESNLEAFADALVAIYEGRSAFEGEIHVETFRGRPVWLQVRAVDTLGDGSGSRVVIGLADITHIKERNQAMARLVKSKDEFIARVSHEIRTPLTAVVGLTSELASVDTMSSKEQREILDLVAGQAAEMAYIVEDLLVAARAEIGTVAIDMTDVDLGDELDATIEGLGTELDEVPASIHPVRADPSRIRQILRNLLTNAERYGGPHRRILAGETDHRVWLEVRDDGEGVSPEMAESIFDPYTTAHQGVVGSVGLGLSVARQLAEMMDGSIEYRREDGETVFRLELSAVSRSGSALASNTRSV